MIGPRQDHHDGMIDDGHVVYSGIGVSLPTADRSARPDSRKWTSIVESSRDFSAMRGLMRNPRRQRQRRFRTKTKILDSSMQIPISMHSRRGKTCLSQPNVAGREHRCRNKGSSARQNASPTSVDHCHGARTRLGPRGGGRLRVLSPDALAPPSLFAVPALPADAVTHRAHLARLARAASSRRDTVPEANHASDATHGVAGNASEGVSGRGPGAQAPLFDRR